MINRKIIQAVVVSAGFMFTGLAHAFLGTLAIGLGEMDQEVGRIQTAFAAEGIFETEEYTGKTRVYYEPGKIRDEMDMGGGQQMVMIRRMDINKFWTLMGQGMYMEVDPEKAQQGSEQAPQYELVSRERIGSETVNGISTTKYKSVYKSADGKFGGFTWFTDDNIAVKAFMIHESKGEKQRLKFEFTNLERGSQDDSLFELPPGAKPFNMGTMMSMSPEQMQQMQQMQNQAGAQQSNAASAGQVAVPSQGQSDSQAADGGFVGEVAQEAEETAKDSAKQETMNEVRDSVRKGIGKLFGR